MGYMEINVDIRQKKNKKKIKKKTFQQLRDRPFDFLEVVGGGGGFFSHAIFFFFTDQAT